MSIRIPPGVALQVDKALRQLRFAASRLGRDLGSAKSFYEWTNDFQVTLSHQNLYRVGVEFLNKRTVVAALWIYFDPRNGKVIDSARGIEVPLLPPGLVDDHRVLMGERDRSQRKTYQQMLAITWEPAESLPRADGSTYESEHAARISANFCRGEFFVPSSAVRRGRVTYVAPRGDWAFAVDPAQMASVFLHKNHCLNGLTFTVGQIVRFIVVSGRRGLQGRNVEIA